MKISLNWLKTLVDFKSSPEELAESLTMAGLEVESIERPFEYLKDIVTGKIESIKPHPDADKLRICMVDTGQEENLQIVCGAPNVYEGMIGPVALPGTTLPGGIKLKKSKIRGEHSFGMLCSSKELAITEESHGIMDLSKDIKPGTPLIDALDLNDVVLDVDLTPNRADCLSMIGIAREVAAIEGLEITIPIADKYTDNANEGKITDFAAVEVKDKDLCPKYCARFIEDVKPAASPWWIQQRLLCAGLRPLNNIVDVTNYVMLETGQPLHAFDYDDLKDAKIIVQRAQDNEKFTTLDGKERTLDSQMLMICDGEKKVAAAGVMGGENSEISDKTTRVLLESAYFFPPSVRKTAKKLGLSTDSSHRFERGIDPLRVEFALNRAAELIEETAQGKTAAGYIDTQDTPFEKVSIDLNVKQCCNRIGIDLSKEETAKYLESVGFKTSTLDENTLKVEVPSYRVDVERPEDLSEEVARRFGYNNIKVTFPGAVAAKSTDVPQFSARNEVKDSMKGLGFNEVINYSFIGKNLLEKCGFAKDETPDSVRVLNPLSEDQALMRTSLVPGILANISDNIAKQIYSLKIFETGQIFIPDSEQDNLCTYKEMICAAWTGSRRNGNWDDKSPEVDFFDMKGIAETFFKGFFIDAHFEKSKELPPYARTGASADIIVNNEKAGMIFEVHPKILKNFDIDQPAFIFLTELKTVLENKTLPYLSREIPKFPSVSRDITLLMPKTEPAGIILDFISQQEEELLESAEIFDIYEGEPIPENEKSISFRLVYRSNVSTLKDKQVNKAHEKLTSKLLNNFNIHFPE